MRTLIEVLQLSTQYLEEKGIEPSRRQAEDLLCDLLNINRMNLYLEFERPLEEYELQQCRERLSRRGKHEPLQYIQGEVEFYACTFYVNSSVLIPRQETEILVDKIAKELSVIDLRGKQLWDLCCGSGCIGIALKKRFPHLSVTLSDISPVALTIAKKNAEKNQVSVEFLEGDLLSPFLDRKADFIVCNPPYISENEYQTLDPEVRLYEPKIALIGGSTGLEFYQRLSEQLPLHLISGGKAWLEIGYQQGEQIKEIFYKYPQSVCRVENDWGGHSRFFFLVIE